MLLSSAKVTCEILRGAPQGDLFRLGDCRKLLREFVGARPGSVKLIYMDPPYMTGEKFVMRVKRGEADWRNNRPSLTLPAFDDRMDRTDYLAMMREVLVLCREALSEDGMLFLHADYRAHPHLRLLMDEIFGEDNFLNEIIWAYQTGGRSKSYFSRKHDVILFYRKGPKYDFHLESVMETPETPRTNHMRRHVDPDGRVYRSIRSGGKVYTYYDDDPVAPSDVWSDVSHIQQKDPQRTGYDTQKPLALLDRIVKCASRPGDTVLDPFCGSGTTLEAAKRLNRRFVGFDLCPLTLNIARRRLEGSGARLMFPWEADAPACAAEFQPEIGFYRVTLEDYAGEGGLEGLDGWAVGFLAGEIFTVQERFVRSHRNPALQRTLMLPVYAGTPAVCAYEASGACHYYFPDMSR